MVNVLIEVGPLCELHMYRKSRAIGLTELEGLLVLYTDTAAYTWNAGFAMCSALLLRTGYYKEFNTIPYFFRARVQQGCEPQIGWSGTKNGW